MSEFALQRGRKPTQLQALSSTAADPASQRKITAGKRPTQAQCDALARRWDNRPQGTKHFNCPDEARWFEAFRRADPSPTKTFVNIGCNKGVDAAAFLHRWDPYFVFKDWLDAINVVFPEDEAGGACGQGKGKNATHKLEPPRTTPCPPGSPSWGCTCQEFADHFGTRHMKQFGWAKMADKMWWIKNGCSARPSWDYAMDTKPPVPVDPQGARPKAHCVELMTPTVKALHRATNFLPPRSKSAPLVIKQLAVGSGYPTHVYLPTNVKAGIETIGVGESNSNADIGKPRPGYDMVNQTTLDEYMDPIPGVIDFLLIDTEGNDPMVLLGGSRTLTRTRIVTFENHEFGMWKNVGLRSVIDYLDTMGFDCYWTGNNAMLWQITGCYLKIGHKKWSNVACAAREDPLAETLRDLARANGGLAEV
eukprot:m.188061 g.188061  ORF g.188061 m.188061 type:complete len:420 (-) comp17288_c0_seq1:196-1455(-)